jgi:hypothetical protein
VEHDGAQRVLHFGAGAGGEQLRQDAEDESEARHEDRPQSQPRRRGGRRGDADFRIAFLFLFGEPTINTAFLTLMPASTTKPIWLSQ